MNVANMMQLHQLCDVIEEKMGETLEIKHFFFVRKIAILFGCMKLLIKCKTFAIENFEAIAEEDDFNSMEMPLFKELMMSENVQANEETKLKILLKWVKFDDKRRDDFLELIKYINFPQISREFVRDCIANEPLINTNNVCLVYVSLAVIDSLPSRATSPQHHHDELPYAASRNNSGLQPLGRRRFNWH